MEGHDCPLFARVTVVVETHARRVLNENAPFSVSVLLLAFQLLEVFANVEGFCVLTLDDEGFAVNADACDVAGVVCALEGASFDVGEVAFHVFGDGGFKGCAFLFASVHGWVLSLCGGSPLTIVIIT